MQLTRRDRTTAAVVLMLIGLWLWVVEDDRPQLVEALPVPESDIERKRREMERKARKAG